jgi:hypothetical protein
MKLDYFTSTVDGAEGFERMHNEMPDDDNFDPGYDVEEREENPDDEDKDDCNCSDPGCPCRGVKHGSV